MNIKRLLNIAQKADKIGDYVTADRVDNLLKTAQGQYSVYPNQAVQTNQQTTQSNQQAPQMNDQLSQNQQAPQQIPQQGGIYYAPVAANAWIPTPGVVNVAKPKMTPEEEAFAKLRGLRGQVQQADQVVKQQSKQTRQYPIYQTYQQPVYQGTNTQAQYNLNPNAPINPNLYGTGYASKAMQPQQPQPPYNPQQQLQPQQPQQQPVYNQRRRPNN